MFVLIRLLESRAEERGCRLYWICDLSTATVTQRDHASVFARLTTWWPVQFFVSAGTTRGTLVPHHQPQGLLQGGYGLSDFAVRTRDPSDGRGITKALLRNLVTKKAVFVRRLPYDWAHRAIFGLLLLWPDAGVAATANRLLRYAESCVHDWLARGGSRRWPRASEQKGSHQSVDVWSCRVRSEGEKRRTFS